MMLPIVDGAGSTSGARTPNPRVSSTGSLRFTGFFMSAAFSASLLLKVYTKQQRELADQYYGDEAYHSRLLSEGNSTDSEEDCSVSPYADPLGSYLNSTPYVAIYLLGMAYMFFGLGYVCEEYFVCAIENPRPSAFSLSYFCCKQSTTKLRKQVHQFSHIS